MSNLSVFVMDLYRHREAKKFPIMTCVCVCERERERDRKREIEGIDNGMSANIKEKCVCFHNGNK